MYHVYNICLCDLISVLFVKGVHIPLSNLRLLIAKMNWYLYDCLNVLAQNELKT